MLPEQAMAPEVTPLDTTRCRCVLDAKSLPPPPALPPESGRSVVPPTLTDSAPDVPPEKLPLTPMKIDAALTWLPSSAPRAVPPDRLPRSVPPMFDLPANTTPRASGRLNVVEPAP